MTNQTEAQNDAVEEAAKEYEGIDPQSILSVIPLLPYQIIADVGSGPGVLTIPFGKYVFAGKVYALDEDQKMLDATQEKFKQINLSNVEADLIKKNKLPLEDESIDGAVVALSLYKSDAPKALLSEVLRLMRRGAWLTIIDWHKRESESGPPMEKRIGIEGAMDLAKEAGFRLTSRHDLNDSHFMLLLRK